MSVWRGGSRTLDISGERFGRLTAIRRLGRKWECVCDCGEITAVDISHLRRGNTKSCGCLNSEITGARNTTHGMTDTPTFIVWQGMLARCLNPKATSYRNYGARGVSVCPRWRDSFENFLADMGGRPKGMTLDRHPNNDGNYEPGNCRWATPQQQANNTRVNVRYDYAGQSLTLSEIATLSGVDYEWLYQTVRTRGKSLEAALADGPILVRPKVTHCKRGHELTEGNVYLHDGKRHCRACRALASKKRTATARIDVQGREVCPECAQINPSCVICDGTGILPVPGEIDREDVEGRAA